MPEKSTLVGSDLVSQFQENNAETRNTISKTDQLIQQKDAELQERIQRSIMQQREIDYKKKIVNTRNRMLQLSQEKNMYKTKVIYTLLAVVLLLVIILLAIYFYFTKST